MIIFSVAERSYLCIKRSLGRNEVRSNRGSRRFSSSGRKCHVERIVASGVHGTRIGQMERERLAHRLRVRAIIHIHVFITISCAYMCTYVRERERDTEVGGPLPLGTRGLRNNRILVRAAERMCTVVKKKRITLTFE